MLMLLPWWYGAGWKNEWQSIPRRARALSEQFSLGILANTLFEPWKQMTSYAPPGGSLEAKLRVLFDNLFARVFGFALRSFFIVVGCLSIAVLSVIGFIVAIAWPFILPAVPTLVVLGVLNA